MAISQYYFEGCENHVFNRAFRAKKDNEKIAIKCGINKIALLKWRRPLNIFLIRLS